MTEKTNLAVYAIGAITAIEIVALYMGMNGTMLALCVAAIAGIGGYKIKGLGVSADQPIPDASVMKGRSS